MYLFSRRARIAASHLREGIALAFEQTERVTQITGLPVRCFQQVFSPRVGTVVWSTFVDDIAQLEAANDKLMADEGYLTAVERAGTALPGGADDALVQIIHGTPDLNRQIEYVTATRAVCAPGGLSRGVSLGIELAQRAEEITGEPTMFGMDTTGLYGGVVWLTGFENIDALQAAQRALYSDSTWLQLIDDGVVGVYAEEPALTSQLVYRRLA